ncbi:hypothetical protein PVK06_009947 [Gossypium arboreum]|uniref:Uncharacterized protein n=1 Tax=Gossypium arboreum TaxID=29729 RepID=A0ABR0QPV4_GOSAR|nr:hypothetical protein PVK06_009947 [Gossypium arboreum]
MPKHLDKPLGDSYEVPSCETTKSSNFELLLDLSDMMAQMRKMLQQISEALSPREEDQDIIIHPKLDDKSQQEFGTEDHGDELNMDKVVSNLIDVAVDLDLVVATNTELKSTLSDSVKELIHFLAIVGELPIEEIAHSREPQPCGRDYQSRLNPLQYKLIEYCRDY